jgi:dual specificity protein kinase YAK1
VRHIASDTLHLHLHLYTFYTRIMDQQWAQPAYTEAPRQDPYASPTSRQNSMPLQSPSGSGSRGPKYNDGDVAMEDADYQPKLNRPSHQQRQSQQFLQQEESAAARRYSPMNLSPTSPYSGNTQQGGQSYTSFTPQAQAPTQSNRQSPTRNNPYMSPPNSYYSPPCTIDPVSQLMSTALCTD